VVHARCGLVGTGQVIFDDASLRLVPAHPAAPLPLNTNLLADPGFEGDGNDWEYSMPPYSGLRIDRDTTQAHSGRACVRFTSSMAGFVQSRMGVCQVLGRGLAGKRVRLSCWVKTDSLMSSRTNMRLYCHSLSRGMVQSETGKSLSYTNDWTPLSFEMDVPSDAVEIWAWFAYFVPTTGVVYYDDTSLEVLGPAITAASPATKKPATPAAKKPVTPAATKPAR
jgi:hypothetical protein